MSTWILVWFVVALITTLAIAVFTVASVRHLLILGRTARQMQDELQPIVEDLGREASRAGAKASSLRPPRRNRS